jgi:branched-chain amino acid aminotransferase
MHYHDDSTLVYLDGKWLKANDARVSLYVQTMHYGNAVFEGIRSYHTAEGTRIFKAEEHYRRLIYSAGRMHISAPWSVEELIRISYRLLEENHLSDAYLRPLIFTGPNMSLTTPPETHLFMCAWKWGKLLGDKTVRVMTSSFCRPHPKSCFVDAKVSGHYTNSILATTEAKQKGFDEALLLDVDGYVAEGPGANFFFEKDNTLFTPPTGNILPGITRATVLDICRRNGIRVKERKFKPEAVRGSDGAFFTGTAAEVTGLESLDGMAFRRPWEKTIGHVLQQQYKACVLHESASNLHLIS